MISILTVNTTPKNLVSSTNSMSALSIVLVVLLSSIIILTLNYTFNLFNLSTKALVNNKTDIPTHNSGNRTLTTVKLHLNTPEIRD